LLIRFLPMTNTKLTSSDSDVSPLTAIFYEIGNARIAVDLE